MEQKNNLGNITYLPELTPHPENNYLVDYYLGVGLIRPNNLRRTLCFA